MYFTGRGMPSFRNRVQTLSTSTLKLLCCFIDPLCALLSIALTGTGRGCCWI